MLKSKRLTVVLDLDDTLYSEKKFLKSGLRFILDSLSELLQVSIELSVEELLDTENPLDVICDHLGFNDSIKHSVLWMYRLHNPDIELYQDAADLIDYCLKNSIGIAIITDGRLLTQAIKLNALKLSNIKSYISEAYNEVKPGLSRFVKVQSDFPSDVYIYIADNPVKDFIAPNRLGWITLGITFRDENIHKYADHSLSKIQTPQVWISDLSEAVQIIRDKMDE